MGPKNAPESGPENGRENRRESDVDVVADVVGDGVGDVVNVALVVACTEAEGPGRRFALWVQGCPLRCPGCCNPEFLPFGGGEKRPVTDVIAAIDAARALGIEGVSLLGGEPTSQAAAMARIAEASQGMGLSVMVYSGFTREALTNRHDDDVDRLLAATDLLVDGPYVEAERTTERRFIGSTNQVLHRLTARALRPDPRLDEGNSIELRLTTDKSGAQVLTVNGWPLFGANTR
jgi:anaerobic ribonucleoside-triphosphate reductase activating protein